MRNLLCRNLHAQVTAGYHNSVRHFNDGIQVFQTFRIFNFCNNRNVFCVVFFQNLTNFQHTLCISNKGRCNKINPLFNTEKNVCFVFFCNSRKLYVDIGHIHALFLAQFTAVYHAADNASLCHFFYFQFNQTIINKNSVAWHYILSQTCVSNKAALFIPGHFLCVKNKLLIFFQGHFLSAFQYACTDFRAFGIQKDSHWLLQLFSHLFQQIHTAFLFFIISV